MGSIPLRSHGEPSLSAIGMFFLEAKPRKQEHITDPKRPVLSKVIRAALRRLDQFFFGPDETRWDLVRISAALTMLVPLLIQGISGNYERLYGHWGMLPRDQAVDVVYWPAFLFWMKSDPAWIWQINGATVAASLCLALGLRTRIAAVATFFLYVA